MKTHHAQVRQQQRGISDFVVSVYNAYGTEIHQKDGSCKIILDKKGLRRVRSFLGKPIYNAIKDELKGKYLIDRDGKTITVAHRYH